MKIVRLIAENFKKLRAVEITPTGEIVEVVGKNGAGKSSVLDSIWAALGGAKHIQAVPIRRGADRARVRLDLGELIVERRFTESGSTLSVENAEGARYKSPQAMLDALLGALSFDPLAFVTQAPREQFDALRKIAPIEVDVDQLDGLNRRDYAKRTETNGEAKKKRAQAEGISVRAGEIEPRVDTAALKDRLAEAASTNAEIERRRARREQAARDVEDKRKGADGARVRSASLRERAADLIRQADENDAQVTSMLADADTLQAKLDAAEPLPELVDADALRAELDQAERTNADVDAEESRRARKAALLAEVEQLEADSRELTATMEGRERAKAEAIAAAKMPVDGLGFGDGIVTFNGIPFEQASTAEQLRVSVAIAMAGNPKLKVIRIKEGSLLDGDNFALIAEMARAHGYQVWLESITSHGGPSVLIEDGASVAVDGQPVEEGAQA